MILLSFVLISVLKEQLTVTLLREIQGPIDNDIPDWHVKPSLRPLYWACNLSNRRCSSVCVLVHQTTCLHILNYDKTLLWNEMDPDSLFWIIHASMAGGYQNVIDSLWSHPLSYMMSADMIRILLCFPDNSMNKPCKLFIIMSLDPNTLNKLDSPTLVTWMSRVKQEKGPAEAANLVKRLEASKLIFLIAHIRSNESKKLADEKITEILNACYDTKIQELDVFHFASVYLLSAFENNTPSYFRRRQPFQWARHLKQKVIQLKDNEIAAATPQKWDVVWRAFKKMAVMNEISSEDMALYRLGFNHRTVQDVQSVENAHAKTREMLEALSDQVENIYLLIPVQLNIYNGIWFQCYPIQSRPLGKALIINIMSHHKNVYATRKGSDKDVNNLTRTLANLGFQPDVYTDLSHDQIETLIERFAQDPIHKTMSCSAVVIMGHGSNGRIIASDNLCISINTDVLHQFSNDKAKGLTGKPKLFFFQVCR